MIPYDILHLGLDAIMVVATAAAFWFFGGRRLATATIDQYKSLVEAQKAEIDQLRDDVARARTELDSEKRRNDYLLLRISELENRLGLARTILSDPEEGA